MQGPNSSKCLDLARRYQPPVHVFWDSKGIIITLSIGTDRPLPIVQTQIRHHILQHLLRVYMVCHTYSNILKEVVACTSMVHR